MSSLAKEQSRESKNTMFTVLSNHRRRYVLYACNQANGETTLSDVAEQVAAWEYDKPINEVTSAERKRVYTSIQQHHLSKLEDAGLIEVEGDRITTTEKAKNLDVYLEVVSEKNIPWALYYVGLAVVGGFMYALAVLELLPPMISVSTVAALFIVIVGISGVAHYIESQQMKFHTADMPPELEE